MADIMDILGGGLPPGLLSQEQEAMARQRAQQAGLTNLGFALLQASQGQPGQRKPSFGQIIGQAGPVGMQAYQQSFDKTLKDTLLGMQVAEMRRKQQESEALRKALPLAFNIQRELAPTTGAFEAGQGLDVMQGGQGIVPERAITGVELNKQMIPALATIPGGIEVATNLLKMQEQLGGKTSVQEIFDPKTGKPIKVRYNEITGEYTPLGGMKQEAPSFTMTDYGVLNTKTGQILQPTDDKGNTIVLDTTVKASEDERKSGGFFIRMKDATSTINTPIKDDKGNFVLDKNGNKVTIASSASKPEFFAETVGTIIPNWMGGRSAQNFVTSAVRQQYQQAQENWVSANLRAESGAAIGVEEMQKEIRKYFPQIGDSDSVIEQKTKAREVAEQAMKQRAGRAISSQSQNINTSGSLADQARAELARRSGR